MYCLLVALKFFWKSLLLNFRLEAQENLQYHAFLRIVRITTEPFYLMIGLVVLFSKFALLQQFLLDFE